MKKDVKGMIFTLNSNPTNLSFYNTWSFNNVYLILTHFLKKLVLLTELLGSRGHLPTEKIVSIEI